MEKTPVTIHIEIADSLSRIFDENKHTSATECLKHYIDKIKKMYGGDHTLAFDVKIVLDF